MQDAEKVEIGYTLPKERWQEAAKNLEDLGNALAASLRAHNKDGLGAEEIADVEIMLCQMVMLFDCAGQVDKFLRYKLERLAERIKEKKHGTTDI